MKLILCPDCQDVQKLIREHRTCDCGKSWGQYDDELNASIGGRAIPLGFENRSLVAAVLNRPTDGLGSRFEAFVIPWKCETVRVLR